MLPSEQTTYHTLIFLHIDEASHVTQCQAQSIIRRYFIGALIDGCSTDPRIFISPEYVLTKCPKLEYYASDGSYDSQQNFIHEALIQSSATSLLTALATSNTNYSNNSEDQLEQQQPRPLLYFSVCDNENTSQIMSLLLKYKDTVKHLRLNQNEWTGSHTHSIGDMHFKRFQSNICVRYVLTIFIIAWNLSSLY